MRWLCCLACCAAALAGCVTSDAGSSQRPGEIDSVAAWRSLLAHFPSCMNGMTIDQRLMDRRIDELAAPLEPSLLSDAGIASDGRRIFAVCSYAPSDSPFVALVLESRGGAGGRDEQYRLLTRTTDGAPIADTIIAGITADCSFVGLNGATLALPAARMYRTEIEVDCERDSIVSSRMRSVSSLEIRRSGQIVVTTIEQ